jgi:hypothetical protein
MAKPHSNSNPNPNANTPVKTPMTRHLPTRPWVSAQTVVPVGTSVATICPSHFRGRNRHSNRDRDSDHGADARDTPKSTAPASISVPSPTPFPTPCVFPQQGQTLMTDHLPVPEGPLFEAMAAQWQTNAVIQEAYHQPIRIARSSAGAVGQGEVCGREVHLSAMALVGPVARFAAALVHSLHQGAIQTPRLGDELANPGSPSGHSVDPDHQRALEEIRQVSAADVERVAIAAQFLTWMGVSGRLCARALRPIDVQPVLHGHLSRQPIPLGRDPLAQALQLEHYRSLLRQHKTSVPEQVSWTLRAWGWKFKNSDPSPMSWQEALLVPAVHMALWRWEARVEGINQSINKGINQG